MKKSELKQIIREEIQKVLTEEKEHEIDLYNADEITLNGESLDSDKLEQDNTKYRNFLMSQEEKVFIYKGKPATIYGIELNDGSVDEPKIYLTTY